MFSTAEATYEYDEENNKEEDFTIDVTADGTLEITVKCKKMPVGSVDFSKLPQDVYMIRGNQAHLPKTVQGTVSADDGAEQPGTGSQEGEESKEITVPILWGKYSELAPGEHTLKGWAAGFECSLKLYIFACDESVGDVAANNNEKKAVKFENSYKGIIETEYDIEMTGTLGDNSLVTYFNQGATDTDLFWRASVSTRFTGGKFFVNGGNGKGGGNPDSSESKEYPAANDRTVVHDGVSTYHVRTRIDTTGVSVTPGTEATEETEATPAVTVGNGSFHVWVIDPNGNTAVKQLYEG